jgi:hypothetical protein
MGKWSWSSKQFATSALDGAADWLYCRGKNSLYLSIRTLDEGQIGLKMIEKRHK